MTPNNQYIDIEVTVAEILFDTGRSSLTELLDILVENDVLITKQLLFYHLQKMIKKGTLLQNSKEYHLPVFFEDIQYISMLTEAFNEIRVNAFNGSKKKEDLDVIFNNIILLNKIVYSEIERSKNVFTKI